MDDGEKILMPNGDMYSERVDDSRRERRERRMKLDISIGYNAEIELSEKRKLIPKVTRRRRIANRRRMFTSPDLAAAGAICQFISD